MFVKCLATGGRGFEWAYTQPDPEPDAPGLVWRETGANYWSRSSGSQPRGTVMLETSGQWVAYVRLEDRPASHPSPQSAATPPSRKHS